MSSTITLQQKLLDPSFSILDNALAALKSSEKKEYKFSLLEACSAYIGGFDISLYRKIDKRPPLSKDILSIAKILAQSIYDSSIDSAIALSVLAAGEMDYHERRKTGAYYTDFRLAKHLATRIDRVHINMLPRIVDPACGAGILLVAYVIENSKTSGVSSSILLANSVFGVDLSEDAIRGAFLALSSLTSDISAIKKLRSHLICADSLLATQKFWKKFAPDGFDGVIGNPPWERLRLLAHEHLNANGHNRHYGDDYNGDHSESLSAQRNELAVYKEKMNGWQTLQGKGERDLYKLFLELACLIVKPNGRINMLIPAGFIRSQGARNLRASVMDRAGVLDITVVDNKARFFAIDTRFKFLIIDADFSQPKGGNEINLRHARGDSKGLNLEPSVKISTSLLKRIRPDLTLPEVKNSSEWVLFRRISEEFIAFGDPQSTWRHRYHRELDMSLDRDIFHRTKKRQFLPLIEGRMVHQFQFGAKAYKSGTGRRAVWVNSTATRVNDVLPQFYIDPKDIDARLSQRSKIYRAGFCDVTGQTNERTMLAALIPPGCICGNKVPTLEFYEENKFPQMPILWISLANSFIFDWLLRRICTTTVNFFILDSIPIPQFAPSNKDGEALIGIAQELIGSTANLFSIRYGKLRAQLEARIFKIYGLSMEDIELVLSDFAQLDKDQTPISGEEKSTITRDFIHLASATLSNDKKRASTIQKRIDAAQKVGAMPFIPNQFSDDNQMTPVYYEPTAD